MRWTRPWNRRYDSKMTFVNVVCLALFLGAGACVVKDRTVVRPPPHEEHHHDHDHDHDHEHHDHEHHDHDDHDHDHH